MDKIGEASNALVQDLSKRAEKKTSGTLVYVGNVPYDANTINLSDILEAAGKIKSILKIGSCYRVDFQTVKGAEVALKMSGLIDYGGKKITIDRERPEPPPTVVAPSIPPPSINGVTGASNLLPIVTGAPSLTTTPPPLTPPVVPGGFSLASLVAFNPELRAALAAEKEKRERGTDGHVDAEESGSVSSSDSEDDDEERRRKRKKKKKKKKKKKRRRRDRERYDREGRREGRRRDEDDDRRRRRRRRSRSRDRDDRRRRRRRSRSRSRDRSHRSR